MEMPLVSGVRIRRAALPGFALVVLLTIGGPGCTSPSAAPAGTASTSPSAAGDWEVLFDGTDLEHWKGYEQDDIPAGWRIEEGLLHFAPGGEGGDLVTRESYGDFELELEWRIGPCGNSGVFYRGAEGAEVIYDTAPEMQVLDDACHPDNRFPSHRAGANYDLHMATPGVVRPAGEWNQVRIVANGPHVEHWLNGEQVVTYEQGSDTWKARVAASKFRDVPTYGTLMTGLIGLQDHGDPVWFRNIRIRRLG